MKPQVEVINIDSKEQLLAASTLGYGDSDTYVDTDSGQLGREDDYDGGISTPNLWDQKW